MAQVTIRDSLARPDAIVTAAGGNLEAARLTRIGAPANSFFLIVNDVTQPALDAALAAHDDLAVVQAQLRADVDREESARLDIQAVAARAVGTINTNATNARNNIDAAPNEAAARAAFDAYRPRR